MNSNIENLKDAFLNNADIEKVNSIIKLIESDEKEKGILQLISVLGTKPKRPIMYVAMHLKNLPDFGTRDSIKYSCDYIDQLARFTIEDKNIFGKFNRKIPLGPKIRKLRKYINKDFCDNLEIYNKVYTEAKHDFHISTDESWFDLEDTVYMIFITKKIADYFLKISKTSRDYNIEGKSHYRYNQID